MRKNLENDTILLCSVINDVFFDALLNMDEYIYNRIIYDKKTH